MPPVPTAMISVQWVDNLLKEGEGENSALALALLFCWPRNEADFFARVANFKMEDNQPK